jgi:hypothetical protein
MRITQLVLIFSLGLFLPACKSCKDKKAEEETPTTPPITTTPNSTLGFNVLSKVQGIWNGPVTSTTPLGGYPEWVVDFRPIAENQVSAKNELDTLNDIFMSFFVVKHDNKLKVAFRNGGSFAGMQRVSYFLIDSVSEIGTYAFYRFSEIVIGRNRAFTDVILKNDSLIINSYTNKYNTQASSTPHMSWRAKLQDNTAAQPAATLFGFPKNTMAKDFSSSFIGLAESIYYNSPSDPYPESAQPYLGQTTINYSFDATYVPNPTKKVFLFIMTQPLFSGPIPNLANLKYRSRYVILSASDLNFVFNYMHPGTYYVYAFYDNDGNNTPNTGDWMSTANTTFTLNALGTTSAVPQINFTIP